MDEWHYERAQAMADAERDMAIERARRNAGPSPVWDHGVAYCAECGDDLPEARARAGYGRCVPCQEAHEHREALGLNNYMGVEDDG